MPSGARLRGFAVLALLACARTPVRPAVTPEDRAAELRTTYPPSVRDRVGLTGERVARYGFASPSLLAAVNAELVRRAASFRSCAPRPASAYASFLVTPDGRVVEPIVAKSDGDAGVEPCVARELLDASFTSVGERGGFVHASIPLGPPVPQAKAPPGWTPPRERHPGCIGRWTGAELLEAKLYGTNGKANFRFVVRKDGSTGEARSLEPVPPQVLSIFERAIAGCAFEPARLADGTPIETWLIQPIKFRSR